MIKTVFFSIYLLLIMQGCSPVKAAQTQVYSFDLVNRMDAKNNEQYNMLWQELSKLGLKFDLNITSYSRYTRAFRSHPESCIFPANKGVVKRLIGKNVKVKLISGEAVDYVGLVALTAAKSDILIRADLAGKNVAISPVLNSKVFLKGIDTQALKTAENNEVLLKMLFRKKVDVVIAFMPDILLAANKLNYPLPYTTDVWLIDKHPFSVVCNDTSSNRDFVVQFNKHLRELKATGRLREIMGPFVNLGDGNDHYF